MRSVRRCFKSFTTLKISSLAEALNNHLAAVHRDHEVRSQIEERKIRIDGAYEDAKRKEKSLQEEKLQQDKNKLKQKLRSFYLAFLYHYCFVGNILKAAESALNLEQGRLQKLK